MKVFFDHEILLCSELIAGSTNQKNESLGARKKTSSQSWP